MNYALYGTVTYAADLWHYRDAIRAIIDSHPDTDGDGYLDVYDNCPFYGQSGAGGRRW